MANVSPDFQAWLKSGPNIRLSTNNAVQRIITEGIFDFQSLHSYDKKGFQHLPSLCRHDIPAVPEDAANGIPARAAQLGAHVSQLSVQRLIIASQAAGYYKLIQREMNVANMHFTNVLLDFKTEWDAYKELRECDEPKVPKLVDRDGD